MVLSELGIGPDSIEPIMSHLRAGDYASLRGDGGALPKETVAAVGKND